MITKNINNLRYAIKRSHNHILTNRHWKLASLLKLEGSFTYECNQCGMNDEHITPLNRIVAMQTYLVSF